MVACGSNPVSSVREGGSAQGENSIGGTSASGSGQGANTSSSSTRRQTASGGANGSHTSGGSVSATGGRTNNAPVEFVVSPTLIPNANDSAPLAAVVRAETNVPTTGSVRVSSDDEAWTLNLDSEGSIHEQALLGVKPNTDYEISVRVTNGEEEIAAPALHWHTPVLPIDFPQLRFVGADPTRMQPGMTLFDVRSEKYVVVVDNAGQVRWYYRAPRTSDRFRVLSNGNIVYISPDSYLTEIDWFGNPVNTWYAANLDTPPSGTIPVRVDGFHHNLDEMPSGNLLTLCRDTRLIDGFPTSAEDPQAATTRTLVHGDEVVEFTRAGEIVKRYSLFDLIDTTRVAHVDGSIADWSHSNAVIYDKASDAYIVSIRHQDAVIKIDRENGALIWILGNHANWGNSWQSKLLAPVGDEFEWQYHQHAVELTPGGVGLYDNGNFRAPAYDPPLLPNYSRAVRFAIDERAMTVTQLWTYQPKFSGAPLYSSAMSDADWQANGNVLIASGTLLSRLDPPGWAQIVEVTESGETVFELDVLESPEATTFDADRIPDIRYTM